jgi:hypothetical protein
MLCGKPTQLYLPYLGMTRSINPERLGCDGSLSRRLGLGLGLGFALGLGLLTLALLLFFGLWFSVFGLWSLVSGLWSLVFCLSSFVFVSLTSMCELEN